MPPEPNTLLLRLEGPLQAWGIQGKIVYRPTELEPTKSGVIGLLACALGIKRWEKDRLATLTALRFGVRVDRQGDILRDYHTIGAGIGNIAASGKIKKTQGTGEVETFLSVRTYLQDAVFVAGLQGDPEQIERCANALDDPAWQIFLGRKSCVPSAKVLIGSGAYPDLMAALKSVPWKRRWANESPPDNLRCQIEATGNDPEADTRYDHPEYFWRDEDHQFARHWPRLVRQVELSTRELPDPDGPEWGGLEKPKRGYYWKDSIWNDDQKNEAGEFTAIRKQALALRGNLCVLTGLPAEEVHHMRYPDDIFNNTPRDSELVKKHVEKDLVPVSRLAHEAITMLEYHHNMGADRIDPLDDYWRPRVLKVINDILTQRVRPSRRSGARRS